MIEITLYEAEKALRKVAEQDAEYWHDVAKWWMRNSIKLNLVCLGVGAAIATVVTYLVMKGIS